MTPARSMVAVLGSMVVLAIGGPSARAAGWVTLPAPLVSETAEGLAGASIAVDGQGNLWLAMADGYPLTTVADGRIRVFERPPGGALTQVLDLAAPFTSPPSLAAGADGTVAVAWSTFPSSLAETYVVTKPPGGSFGSPQQLGGDHAAGSSAAVLSDGTVLVSWTDVTSGRTVELAAGHSPSELANVPIGGQGASPVWLDLTTNGSGQAILLWKDEPPPSSSDADIRLAYAEWPAGGPGPAGLTAQTLRERPRGATETSQSFDSASMRLDPAGDAAAVWEVDTSTAAGETATLQASVRPAGGAFPTRQTLDSVSGASVESAFGQIPAAFDASRNATVLWGHRRIPGGQLDQASASPPSYAFGPLVTGGAGNEAVTASLAGGEIAAIAADRNADGYCTSDSPLATLLSPGAGAAFTAGPVLANSSQVVRYTLVPDAGGDAFAAWDGSSVCGSPLGLAAFDATPPKLGTIAVPAAVTAGKPADLSVNPVDAVSSVASVNWSFGDGQSATGISPAHSWAAPGTYTVVASATDAAGNIASTATPVQVTPPVAAPAPAAPTVTHLAQSHRIWREGSRLPHLAKHSNRRRPVGTTFTFSLNEAARVTLAFSGKPHGSKKRAKATLILTGHAGVNKVSFQGRTSRSKRLRPGRYTLAITATAANRTSGPATTRFTITPG